MKELNRNDRPPSAPPLARNNGASPPHVTTSPVLPLLQIAKYCLKASILKQVLFGLLYEQKEGYPVPAAHAQWLHLIYSFQLRRLKLVM